MAGTVTGEIVQAAGGVVVRPGGEGRAEVLLVHRQRYDDWTFPKGKLDEHDGGSHERCALREVAEETGYRCALVRELPSTAYVDGQGRAKRVRYWAMTVVDGSFVPNREVDAVRWVTVDDARRLLTYRHDVAVLDGLSGIVPGPAAEQ